MKEQILQTLHDLRTYALAKQIDAAFFLHEEESCLMRCANSAISLNTNEHLLRLEITAYEGRKRASFELITALGNMAEMRQGVDRAAEMVKHAQALDYQPTMPAFSETFIDESGFDAGLAGITNAARLEFFNQAVAGLEADEITLSGIFSTGVTTLAQITTRSEHCQYFKTTDAQISIVLSHATRKWELLAEQSARQITDLDPSALHRDLAFLLEQYQQDTPCQLALGRYDVVFGSAAIAELIDIMNFIGFDGGSMKRGFSFITGDQVGQKVLSSRFTLSDDPTCLDTFPFQRDFMGMPRKPFPIFANGVFRSFTWSQDDADEFGTAPTGHTVMHKSLVLAGGNTQVSTLKELVDLPHSNDLLYIPSLHYLNIVNPSTGLITASSRFGALLLTKEGSVVVPYNVRITQSLLDIFGNRLAWLSQTQVVSNTSSSYGARNPTAIVVPAFVQVNDLEISHANARGGISAVARYPIQQGDLKMNTQWQRRTVLLFLSLFFISFSNAWGESWNRAVKNSSSQPVTITVDAGHGNVWFTGACTSENGPCTIPPNSQANTKFTTTAGMCNGTFKFKHGTAPECTCRYFGGTQSSAPAVRFSTSTCPPNIKCNIFTTTDQWWGYVEITD